MPTTDKLTPKLIKMYVAVLIILVGGWATNVITHATKWADVWNDKNTLALALAFIGWLVLTAGHYMITGDPSPVMPAAEPISGELMTIEADTAYIDATRDLANAVNALTAKLSPSTDGPPPPVPTPPADPENGHPAASGGHFTRPPLILPS